MHLCLQAIKESATELLFGGHETTASTATSLVMFLGLNPEVVDKMRLELMDKVIHGMQLLLSCCANPLDGGCCILRFMLQHCNFKFVTFM